MVKNNKIRQTYFKKFLMWLKSTNKQATAIPPNQGVQQCGKTEEEPLVSVCQPFSPHHTHTKYYLHDQRPQATVLLGYPRSCPESQGRSSSLRRKWLGEVNLPYILLTPYILLCGLFQVLNTHVARGHPLYGTGQIQNTSITTESCIK